MSRRRQLPSATRTRDARGVVHDNIIMVQWWCMCVCVYTLENVSVTAGARSIGRARYGLWTATERQLRRRWRRSADRHSALATPHSTLGRATRPPDPAWTWPAPANGWDATARTPTLPPITITATTMFAV